MQLFLFPGQTTASSSQAVLRKGQIKKELGMAVPHLQVATAECIQLLLDTHLVPSILKPSRVLSSPSYSCLLYVPCFLPCNEINPYSLGLLLHSHNSKSLETKLEQNCSSPSLFYATVFPNLHKYVCPTSYLAKDHYSTPLTALLPISLEPFFLKNTVLSHSIFAVTMPHPCHSLLGIA